MVLDGKSSQEYPVNAALEFLKAQFLVLHFSYRILMTFLIMLSVIMLSRLLKLFSILSVIRHLIGGNNPTELASELESDLPDMTGGGSGFLISMLKNLIWFHLTSLIRHATDVEMDGSVLEEKSSFKMLGLTFSSKVESGLLHYLYSTTMYGILLSCLS